jgi:RNA-directed DNA polymerase
MPVERRGIGRWKREGDNRAKDTAVSERRALSTRRRNPCPLGVGGRGRSWTERMLKALETGLEGGKWFRLIDKVWSENNLRSALRKVVAKGGSAGVDGRGVSAVERQSEEEIACLQKQLREGQYRPAPVKRVWLPKLGSHEKRPVGVPTVRDRIVQSALRHVMEPIFEREFAPQSYGFRPGRGCKEALRRVEELLHAGRNWVVDADLKSYFDTIPHALLRKQIERKIADGKVLGLVESYLQAGVMESAREWHPGGEGTPQGAVISPLLANIYLNPLDWEMAGRGWEMVRYADDFVILCQSEEEALRGLEKVREWVESNGLKLHTDKTRIIDASQRGGFDFLGYHFERGKKWPRQKSMDKLKDAIRGKRRRTQGRSLSKICHDLNRTLVGSLWILPTQQQARVRARGQICARTSQKHPAPAPWGQRARAWARSSTLA